MATAIKHNLTKPVSHAVTCEWITEIGAWKQMWLLIEWGKNIISPQQLNYFKRASKPWRPVNVLVRQVSDNKYDCSLNARFLHGNFSGSCFIPASWLWLAGVGIDSYTPVWEHMHVPGMGGKHGQQTSWTVELKSVNFVLNNHIKMSFYNVGCTSKRKAECPGHFINTQELKEMP